MPTRRAFLCIGAAFAGGAVLGTACGYSLGKAAAVEAAGDGEPERTGDADLDELRRLAVKAPIEELVAMAPQFLTSVARDYRQDEILWRGVARLCDQVVADQQYPNRRLMAAWLAQIIRDGEPAYASRLAARIPSLQEIR